MNNQERLNLKKLMQQNDYEDNTEGIRRLKHSDLIQAEILRMEDLKKTHKNTDKLQFQEICQEKCSFLYSSYTDIFNRLLKDELDLGLMNQVLVTLKKIENGEIDQQEGSVMVGKMLHRVFVESALKRGDILNNENAGDSEESAIPKNNGKALTWKEYKRDIDTKRTKW